MAPRSPEIPELLRELVMFVNRLPPTKDTWKRLRIAVTEDELASFRQFFREDNPQKEFYWAVRGVPLILVEEPMRRDIIVEYPEASDGTPQS